jgi:adenosylhomocysteine nucleosidase
MTDANRLLDNYLNIHANNSESSSRKAVVMVAAALAWEARTVLRRTVIVHSETGSAGTLVRATTEMGAAVDVLTTGMGPRHAKRALTWALERSRPAAIVSLGCAGALDPALRPGDVVVASQIRVAGSASLEIDGNWGTHLERAAQACGLHAVSGPLLTTPEILAGAADKRQARAESAAIAVEMEAAALGRAAHEAKIPFAAVRAILDVADDELTFARNLVAEDGRLRLPALFAALLRGRGRAVRELRTLAAHRRLCARSLELLSGALFERLVANEKALG